MNIVFLAPGFYPDIGGVEKHAFEVAKILSKQNKVTVVTEGKKDKKENIKGIKVIRLFFGRRDWFRKFIIWGRLLSQRKIFEKADIIHCHDVFFWYIPLRLIYPRKKVFITFHGYETVFPPKISAVFIRRLSEKLSNGNIAVGAYIEKWYGTKPNIVIYGAADKLKERKIKSLSSNPKIIFVGRIEKDTGVETYTRVLELLRKYKFEACGDGILRKEFAKFGKVHGFVKGVDKIIRKADIVFASSYLSIITAMKLKKPVFAVFENPLKRDYLRLTPFSKWIYVSNSPRFLVWTIRRLAQNRKKREKNLNLAYNWANNQSWDNIVRKYIELWKV